MIMLLHLRLYPSTRIKATMRIPTSTPTHEHPQRHNGAAHRCGPGHRA
jgi:hypothetical protein